MHSRNRNSKIGGKMRLRAPKSGNVPGLPWVEVFSKDRWGGGEGGSSVG